MQGRSCVTGSFPVSTREVAWWKSGENEGPLHHEIHENIELFFMKSVFIRAVFIGNFIVPA